MNNKYQKLCSVLITCYQREKYIKKSVMSVYNQSYRPVECIVVDDGSTDNSLKILKKLEIKFNEDKYFDFKIVSTLNRGANAARNTAFELSKGEYIQYLDSDDILHPNKLELQSFGLNKYKKCDSAWNPQYLFKNKHTLIFEAKDSISSKLEKKCEDPFIPQFMAGRALHRRNVFEKSGEWTETLKRWQDFEYQVRIMNSIENYLVFDKPLYFFRQHNDGRINDMFGSSDGVNAGFLSMQSLQNHLSLSQKKLEIVRKTLRDSYASLFKTAITNNLTKESIQALKYSLNWSSTLKFSVKINVLIICILILPLFLIKLILKINGFLANK